MYFLHIYICMLISTCTQLRNTICGLLHNIGGSSIWPNLRAFLDSLPRCDSYLWHDSFIYHSSVWYDSVICVIWLIYICDMTHSYVWHDSFICVTWLSHVCDLTQSCVWHDESFICVTWLSHVCDTMQYALQHTLQHSPRVLYHACISAKCRLRRGFWMRLTMQFKRAWLFWISPLVGPTTTTTPFWTKVCIYMCM